MAKAPAAVLRYDPSARYEVRTRDVVYRRDGTRDWLARVHEPQGPGPFPALIDIHGGGWQKYDRTRDAAYLDEIPSHGLVVMTPDFRQSGEAPYPASMQDVNYATRWLKAHAADFNASPEQLGGSGWSSGGHLVMLSAMRPRDPRYTALPLAEAPDVDAGLAYVILGWPVIDPHGRHLSALAAGNGPQAENQTMYFLDEETMKEASPLLILERGEKVETPPALHVQGSADTAHPLPLAARFLAAYSSAGGFIESGRYPGAESAFLGKATENAWRARAQIMEFIARQLAAIQRDR